MEEDYFEIANSGDLIRLTPLEIDNSNTEWGVAIIEVEIFVKALPFTGTLNAQFTDQDFDQLYNDLERLNNDFGAEMLFENFEHDIIIKVAGDGLGHFLSTIQIFGNYHNSKLEFELPFDQSHISAMLQQLQVIRKKVKPA